MNYKMVYIIGVQRSGTSSLAHLLSYNDNILSCLHVAPFFETYNQFKTFLIDSKGHWASPKTEFYNISPFSDYQDRKKKRIDFPCLCVKNDEGEFAYIDKFVNMDGTGKVLLIYNVRDSLFSTYKSWVRWQKKDMSIGFEIRVRRSFEYMNKIFPLVESGLVDLCCFSFFCEHEVMKERARKLMNTIGFPLSNMQERFLDAKIKVARTRGKYDRELVNMYYDIPNIEILEENYNFLIGQVDNGLIKKINFKEIPNNG